MQNAINNLGKCVVRLLACLVIFAENVIWWNYQRSIQSTSWRIHMTKSRGVLFKQCLASTKRIRQDSISLQSGFIQMLRNMQWPFFALMFIHTMTTHPLWNKLNKTEGIFIYKHNICDKMLFAWPSVQLVHKCIAYNEHITTL